MLTLAYPWLLLLAPLPWLVRRYWPMQNPEQAAIRVPFLQRNQFESQQKGEKASRKRLLIPLLVWLGLLLALTRPQWLEPPIVQVEPARDLLLLVDLSASMLETDFTDAKGDRVSRLDAVKQILADFLLRREGDRVGLVLFGSSPFLQVPFTTDLALSAQLLDEAQVGMAGPKTALGDAIGLAINLFDQSEVEQKTIIVLTDGNDTSSAVPPVEAARIARDRNIKIHTVAMGDPETVGEEQLDVKTLQQIARDTGGESYLALDTASLEKIYQTLDELEVREVKTRSHRPKRDLYFWPLAFSLILSLLQHLMLIRRHAKARPQAITTRVKVDKHTGQLEVK